MAFTPEQKRALRASKVVKIADPGPRTQESGPTSGPIDFGSLQYPVLGGRKYAKVYDLAQFTLEQIRQIPGAGIFPHQHDLRPGDKKQ